MVYYILNITGNIRKALNGENIGCAGADPEILKMGGVLYVSHHGWPTKNILGFR